MTMNYVISRSNGSTEIGIAQVLPQGAVELTDVQYDGLIDGTLSFIAGEVVATPAPPAPTQAEILAAAKLHFISLATNQLNAAAAAKNYSSIDTACAYSGAPNPFQVESQSFVTYRGNVWAACYQLQSEVLAGTRAMPTDAEFLAYLPVAP